MKNLKSYTDFVVEMESSLDEKFEKLPVKDVQDIIDKIRKAVEQKMGKTDAAEIGAIIANVMSEK
jgi:hypothetical protein